MNTKVLCLSRRQVFSISWQRLLNFESLVNIVPAILKQNFLFTIIKKIN